MSFSVLYLYLLMRLNVRFVRGKRPFGNGFFTRCEFPFYYDDFIQRNALDALGCKINDCAVVCLIRKSSRVLKVTKLGLIIPNTAGSGYSLIVALIKDDASLGDYLVLGFDHRDLVSLQTVYPVTNVHVAFMNNNTLSLWPFDRLLIRINDDLAVAALWCECRCFLWLWRRDTLFSGYGIYIRSICDRVGDLPLDGVRLLRLDGRNRNAH